MRKAVLFVLVVNVTLGMDAQGALRPRGDVNCDWEVTIADVNSLIESIVDGVAYHPFYTYALDVNGDHEINIADINVITHAVTGGQLEPMPAFSGTLPVLYINTEGCQDIVGKEHRLPTRRLVA